MFLIALIAIYTLTPILVVLYLRRKYDKWRMPSTIEYFVALLPLLSMLVLISGLLELSFARFVVIGSYALGTTEFTIYYGKLFKQMKISHMEELLGRKLSRPEKDEE